jgi:hypothetical protein
VCWDRTDVLFMASTPTSEELQGLLCYTKGGCVISTRQEVALADVMAGGSGTGGRWWKLLNAFNVLFRYVNYHLI